MVKKCIACHFAPMDFDMIIRGYCTAFAPITFCQRHWDKYVELRIAYLRYEE